MVYSYYEATNDTGFVRELLPALDKEYQFWMNNRSVYVSQCDCTANRYASPVTTPRYCVVAREERGITQECNTPIFT